MKTNTSSYCTYVYVSSLKTDTTTADQEWRKRRVDEEREKRWGRYYWPEGGNRETHKAETERYKKGKWKQCVITRGGGWFCGHFLRLCLWEELPDSHRALLWDSHLFPNEDEGMRSPALWIKWQPALAIVVLCILGCECFPFAGCENWAGQHLGFSQTEQPFYFF